SSIRVNARTLRRLREAIANSPRMHGRWQTGLPDDAEDREHPSRRGTETTHRPGGEAGIFNAEDVQISGPHPVGFQTLRGAGERSNSQRTTRWLDGLVREQK